jgi:TPR repeat protein
MRRAVVDHEVVMLAALHSMLAARHSALDGRARFIFTARLFSRAAAHTVRMSMIRKIASESQQVREVIASCRRDGSVEERLVLAFAAMYGYGGKPKEPEKSFELFQELAKEDRSGVAHRMLAAHYQNGLLMADVDLERAIELYKEGLALGNAACMSYLGLMLHKGEERHRDLPEAMRLFRAAAVLGDPRGINNAAVFLLERDLSDVEGRALMKRAADLDEGDACYSMYMLYQHEAPRMASRYLLRCPELLEEGTGLYNAAIEDIAALAWKNPDALVPYGYWGPRRKVHKWVSPAIGNEMRIVLMMRKRPDSLWHQLPRDLAFEICFWLCTLPQPGRQKEGMLATGLNWLGALLRPLV